jgi:hypothetical protein
MAYVDNSMQHCWYGVRGMALLLLLIVLLSPAASATSPAVGWLLLWHLMGLLARLLLWMGCSASKLGCIRNETGGHFSAA